MRRRVLLMAFCTLGGAPATAGDLPAALTERLKQGVQACVEYYLNDTPLAALQKHGFAQGRKGMELTLVPPAVRHKVRVQVFTEGRGEIECETHAKYTSRDALKHAFNLTVATVAQNGFTRLRVHHYASKAKTIFERGSTSMFMLVRAKQGKVMIKFKRRSR